MTMFVRLTFQVQLHDRQHHPPDHRDAPSTTVVGVADKMPPARAVRSDGNSDDRHHNGWSLQCNSCGFSIRSVALLQRKYLS